MFTSATESAAKKNILIAAKDVPLLRKRAFRGLLISLALAAGGAVYEHFSHGVWSCAMVYAFMIPLAGVTLPSMLLERSPKRTMPGELPVLLWHFGLAVLTVGSLFSGALEIYGTTNSLTRVYWWAGGLLTVSAALLMLPGMLNAGEKHGKKDQIRCSSDRSNL